MSGRAIAAITSIVLSLTLASAPAEAKAKKRALHLVVVTSDRAIEGHPCLEDFGVFSDIKEGLQLRINVGHKTVARPKLGPGEGNQDEVCEFAATKASVPPSAKKVVIRIPGGYDPVVIGRKLLTRSRGFLRITLGDEPDGPMTDNDLVFFAGKRCGHVGDTTEPIDEATFATDVPTPNNGLVCNGFVWAWVIDAGLPCGLFNNAAAQTPAGTKLLCASGYWLASGQPLERFFDGTYSVGTATGQVRPGTYEAFNVSGCYWERLDSAGEIIDNNFIDGAPRAAFTVQAGDYAIHVEGCGEWRRAV